MENSLNSEDTESHANLETILKNKTNQNKKTQIHHLLEECSQGYNCSYNFQIPRKDKCFPK